MIDDDEIETALHRLIALSDELGAAAERAKKADKMIGHTEAIQMKQCNESGIGAKQMFARASQAYVNAINEDAAATGSLRAKMSEKDALESLITAWQTMKKAQQGPRP